MPDPTTSETVFIEEVAGATVYDMAQALAHRIDDEVLRIQIDPHAFLAGLENGQLVPGNEVAFEVRLPDGTTGLSGRGTLLIAQVSKDGCELKLRGLQLGGPGAMIVKTMMSGAREARRSSLPPRGTSPSVDWDEATLNKKTKD